jgi:hypothetical protein
MINYDNVTLVPRVVSSLESRSEADTSIIFCGVRLEVPAIATPMPDVCNGEMAKTLAKLGAMGIIHRFQSIEDEVREFKFARHPDIHLKPEYMKYHDIACAIGATGDYQDRFEALYDAGCRIFCIDTANGANIQVKKAIEWIQEWHKEKLVINQPGIYVPHAPDFVDKIYLIAGAVATKEGYAFLANLGVDGVRVGIAGGCFTPEMDVLTDIGNKKISEIKIGDAVLSHNGSFNCVENIFEFEHDDDIMIINGIECTKNHEFYVLHCKYANIVDELSIEKYAEWIPAEKLTNEYFLIKPE